MLNMQYLFFDTALNGLYALSKMKETMPVYLPLLAKEENISDEVAPYIFQLNSEEPGYVDEVPGINLKEILFLNSEENIKEVRNHFQKMTVQNIKGKPFYFRFWCEKVFKKYIISCDEFQLSAFFGTVKYFVCNDDDTSQLLFYKLDKSRLVIEKKKKEIEMDPKVVDKETTDNKTFIDLDVIPTTKRTPRKFF